MSKNQKESEKNSENSDSLIGEEPELCMYEALHYLNTHNQVSLSLVDYDLTKRLNRESGVEVRLPAK